MQDYIPGYNDSLRKRISQGERISYHDLGPAMDVDIASLAIRLVGTPYQVNAYVTRTIGTAFENGELWKELKDRVRDAYHPPKLLSSTGHSRTKPI